MGHTNKTTKFQLPQFSKTDKPQMTDFNDAFKNIDDKVVSKSGDTMTGNLAVSKPSYPQVTVLNTGTGRSFIVQASDDNKIIIQNRLDANNRTFITINNEATERNDLVVLTRSLGGEGANYKLFGEHNKPSGSYTGNGSAASRTVNIGGIGDVLHIRGGALGALISSNGGIVWDTSKATVTVLSSAEANFNNGILTIATASYYVNANGVTYGYKVS